MFPSELLRRIEFSSIFITRNGIPSCFLFRGMVRNRIPSVCFYCCYTERNSELFSLPRNGSEQNYESLLLFLFLGTEFRAFFSSAERFGTEFRVFCSAEQPEFRQNKPIVLSIPSPRNNFFVRNGQPYHYVQQKATYTISGFYSI
jgi:hypothetical protein